MGASNIGFRVGKNVDLNKWYESAVREAQEEYGTDPYNGTISTTRGIGISSRVFSNENEAEEYVIDHTEKWGSVLAVKVKNDKQEFWFVGGWAAE